MNSYGTPSIAIQAIKPVSKVKIGWVCQINWDAAQTRIRVLNVNQYLRSIGYQSNIVSYEDIIEKNYDVAIVGKSFDETNYKNIKLLKQYGKIVFCDLCESILEFDWVKEIIMICDRIICCSYKLEELVKQINPRTIVIEDAWEI
jgi:hypothetical protein